jgi:hypothetical protein
MISLLSDENSATLCCPPPADSPLGLHLLEEHQRRYERIKAWREAQRDPYFAEVTPQWRREFERKSYS